MPHLSFSILYWGWRLPQEPMMSLVNLIHGGALCEHKKSSFLIHVFFELRMYPRYPHFFCLFLVLFLPAINGAVGLISFSQAPSLCICKMTALYSLSSPSSSGICAGVTLFRWISLSAECSNKHVCELNKYFIFLKFWLFLVNKTPHFIWLSSEASYCTGDKTVSFTKLWWSSLLLPLESELPSLYLSRSLPLTQLRHFQCFKYAWFVTFVLIFLPTQNAFPLQFWMSVSLPVTSLCKSPSFLDAFLDLIWNCHSVCHCTSTDLSFL